MTPSGKMIRKAPYNPTDLWQEHRFAVYWLNQHPTKPYTSQKERTHGGIEHPLNTQKTRDHWKDRRSLDFVANPNHPKKHGGRFKFLEIDLDKTMGR